MSDLSIALLGAAVPVAVAAIYRLVVIGSSLPRRVVRLEEIAALSLDAQDANTEGMIAIAEAVSLKRNNGNIDDAITRLKSSKTKTAEYVNAHVAGGPR